MQNTKRTEVTLGYKAAEHSVKKALWQVLLTDRQTHTHTHTHTL